MRSNSKMKFSILFSFFVVVQVYCQNQLGERYNRGCQTGTKVDLSRQNPQFTYRNGYLLVSISCQFKSYFILVFFLLYHRRRLVTGRFFLKTVFCKIFILILFLFFKSLLRDNPSAKAYDGFINGCTKTDNTASCTGCHLFSGSTGCEMK